MAENEKPDFEHDYFNVGASEPMRLENGSSDTYGG